MFFTPILPKGKASIVVLVALMCIALSGCDRTRMDKGYEYFPDMAHSYAYQTYSDNPAMADGMTMRTPVEGTVPRHIIPYPYADSFEGRELAGENLFLPFSVNEQVLSEGEALYNIFCSSCHGTQGDGQGKLYTSGKYIIPPTSLISDETKALPQGEVYHVITKGWGLMGPHGSLIQAEERWKIIAFIEDILQAQ